MKNLMRTRISEALAFRIASFCSTVGKYWRGLVSDRPDHYWPERHYMRGPGPKWREKHAGIPAQHK